MNPTDPFETVEFTLFLGGALAGRGKARTGLSSFHRTLHHSLYICRECGVTWAKIYSDDEGAQYVPKESLCPTHGGGSIYMLDEFSIPISYPLTRAVAAWELDLYLSNPKLYPSRDHAYSRTILLETAT